LPIDIVSAWCVVSLIAETVPEPELATYMSELGSTAIYSGDLPILVEGTIDMVLTCKDCGQKFHHLRLESHNVFPVDVLFC